MGAGNRAVRLVWCQTGFWQFGETVFNDNAVVNRMKLRTDSTIMLVQCNVIMVMRRNRDLQKHNQCRTQPQRRLSGLPTTMQK